MKRTCLFAALLALSSMASATVICTNCEDGDAAGNYLGAFNVLTGDTATFRHSDIARTLFVDFWVFDVGPVAANGSTSAVFMADAFLRLFRGQLWSDGGSTCTSQALGCRSVELGELLADEFVVNRGWEILFDALVPGRYVLRISGGTLPPRPGGYTGQIGFLPISVREGSLLGIFGLGLIAIAVIRLKRG